jgi:alkylation response protein AidB-like acyl-CoA dehydrogenase
VAYLGPVVAHDALRRVGAAADAPTVAVSNRLRAGEAGLAVDAAGATTAVAVGGGGAVTSFALTGIEPIGGIDLTRAVLPLAGVTGTAFGGLDADGLLAWEALAVTLTAADLVGAMEGAFALANEYAKERRQYGAPIGSFQAVQHLLAESKTLIEGAYSAMIHAAWAVDALPPAEARAAAAVAKAYAGRAARAVCETSIQVHGGIGNTWECMAHVYLRRALLSTELFGDDGAQLAFLAEQRWGARVGLS